MLFKAWFASPAGHLSEATFCHPRTCDGEAHKGRSANAQAGETSVEEESDVKYANYGERRKRLSLLGVDELNLNIWTKGQQPESTLNMRRGGGG